MGWAMAWVFLRCSSDGILFASSHRWIALFLCTLSLARSIKEPSHAIDRPMVRGLNQLARDWWYTDALWAWWRAP